MDDLSPLLNQVLGFYCHRMPERMLHCGEASSILCARCTGIYTGVFVGAVIIWLRGGCGRQEDLPRDRRRALASMLRRLAGHERRLDDDGGDTVVHWVWGWIGLGSVGAVLARGNNVGPRQAARARWYVITSVVVATIIVVLSKCGWVMLLSAASGWGCSPRMCWRG